MERNDIFPEQTPENNTYFIDNTEPLGNTQIAQETQTKADSGLLSGVNEFISSKRGKILGVGIAGAVALSGAATESSAIPMKSGTPQHAKGSAHPNIKKYPKYNPGRTSIIKKTERMIKPCLRNDGLAVNKSVISHRKNKQATLKVYDINEGHRQKFKWTHMSRLTVCAMFGYTESGKVIFPKPTKEGKKGGYFVDPESNSADPLASLSMYFRYRK